MRSDSLFIGIGKIWLEIFECKSLKEKRSIIKSVTNRIREKFQISVSEIGQHDSKRDAVIGISLLSNQKNHLQQCMSAVIESLKGERNARLVDFKTEIINAGKIQRAPEMEFIPDESTKLIENQWLASENEEKEQ